MTAKINSTANSWPKEHSEMAGSKGFTQVIQNHLDKKGIAIDFDAGSAPYRYSLQLGTSSGNSIVGGAERDYLWGRAGADALSGGSGDDNLFGDAGADVLVGGDGADRLMGGMGNDKLYGGSDADGLMGGMGDDILDEGDGHGDLNGGPGNDLLIGGQGADAFMIAPDSGHDIIRDFTAGPGMFDHLAIDGLHWGDLRFSDTADGVKISWDGGSVVLNGVLKSELSQDDFMFADAPELPPATRVATAPAPERASPSSAGPAIVDNDRGNPAADRIADAMLRRDAPVDVMFTGDQQYEVSIGTSKADHFMGSPSWDQMFGRDGNDQLHGGDGNDILQGDAGDDALYGDAGSDRLDGGGGDDDLYGGNMEDHLAGGDGADMIDAGAGHDMIEGGMGNDMLRGGTGADAFMVMPDSGHDTVLDFEVSGAAQGAFDHIAFMNILASQVSVRDTTNGALVAWDANGDGMSEGSVLLQGVYTADLRQSDFMFNEEPGFVVGISTVGSAFVF